MGSFMRTRIAVIASFVATTILGTSAEDARATTELSASAGGGLAAVAARVDLATATLYYRTCAASPCGADASSAKVAITLDRALFPDARDVVVEEVDLGGQRRLLHVRVPSKEGAPRFLAWEALVVAGRAPVFAGLTGLARGD